MQLSQTNNALNKDLKTVFLITKPEFNFISSSMVREILVNNGNISKFVPKEVEKFLLKENDILIAETGIIPHGVAQMKFPHNAELLTQTLWGSIGWATPATLGVSVAKPNSRVILFTGDGSHQLTALEIGTLLRLKLKPVIIVLNNSGYTIERVLAENVDSKFNDIVQMNYSKFARVFDGDIWATKVTTADEFDKALKVTQIMNKLCYIEICTDKLDMPSLTKDLIESFKTVAKNDAKKFPKKSQVFNRKDETTEIKKEKRFSFETIVHTSLKNIGE